MTKSWRHVLLALLLANFAVGCAGLRHELQPHRLRRWNYGDAPSLDPDFTSTKSPARTGLVRAERPTKQPAVTANCAEVVLARGQNPQ